MGYKMISDEDYEALLRVIRKVDNIHGTGISHYPDSIHFASANQVAGSSTDEAVESHWMKITGATASGKRWQYSGKIQKKTTAGYGGWVDDTSFNEITTAYNMIENMNGATGLWGNGVTSTNLSGSIDIKPAPTGAIVRVYLEIVSGATPTREWWFQYENGIDGAC